MSTCAAPSRTGRYDAPFVLDFAGAEAATVRAVTGGQPGRTHPTLTRTAASRTVYYGLYSNETRATYSLTNCSSAWFLDMSSVYTASTRPSTHPSVP